MVDRRRFLAGTAGLAGVAALDRLLAAQRLPSVPMPQSSLLQSNPEAYWYQLRSQFLIPDDEAYLNNGTNGCNPLPVLKAVFDGYLTTEKMDQADPEDYPIWGYGPWNEFRDPLAQFLGVNRDELALLRNATEANNIMSNGLDMKAGEEVLISDQEHPSGEQPWNLRAARYGIVVKKFEIPKPLTDTAALLNRISDAITPQTRVLFVSHITTATGVVLPVKEICALAKSKGLIAMVDGAQVPGMMRLNIKEIGCDMYGASPHKWMQAPKGTGFLYVRDELIDRVWSNVTTSGWDDKKLRAERFQRIGSSNVPALWGLRASVEFASSIGMDRIEERQRKLNDYIWAQMQKRGAENWTGDGPFRCAIVSVNTPPLHIHQLEYAMWKDHKIRIRGGEPYKIRLCTPYYLRQKQDIDRFLEAFDEYKKKGLTASRSVAVRGNFG